MNWRCLRDDLAMVWQAVNFPIILSPLQTTLWCIAISEWQDVHDQLYDYLSTAEQARANRFKFLHHQRRFTITRGVLRLLLAQVLGITPESVPLVYSPHGKPELAASCASLLNFNLSHSHDLAIYALGFAVAIGVDVEYLRPIPELEGLVKRFFSTQEADFFEQVPPSLRIPAFFRAWTQKEAYLKCLGTGLSTALDQVEVSLEPYGPAALHRVAPALSWRSGEVVDFIPAENYIGAIAVDFLEMESSKREAMDYYRLSPVDLGILPAVNA